MSIFPKLYGVVMKDKLETISNAQHLRAPTQGGFRRNFRLEDNCILFKFLIQHSRWLKHNLHCMFIDLEKAYDSIMRQKLWTAFLEELHIDPLVVDALKPLYVDLKARIRDDPLRGQRFVKLLMGVKQGCACSPILFSIFFDRCVKEVEK